jgi:hypothetical protein
MTIALLNCWQFTTVSTPRVSKTTRTGSRDLIRANPEQEQRIGCYRRVASAARLKDPR